MPLLVPLFNVDKVPVRVVIFAEPCQQTFVVIVKVTASAALLTGHIWKPLICADCVAYGQDVSSYNSSPARAGLVPSLFQEFCRKFPHTQDIAQFHFVIRTCGPAAQSCFCQGVRQSKLKPVLISACQQHLSSCLVSFSLRS